MPSYQDFERDYWAPDRDDVLNRMRSGPQGPQTPPPPETPQWQAPGAPANTGFTGQMGQAPPMQAAPTFAPQKIAAPLPAANFDRTAFRDSWMSTGSDRARQDQLLQQYGLTLDPAGRATLPTGEIIDLRLGAKAGGTQASWTNAGGTQNGVPVTGGPSGGFGAGAGSGYGGMVGGFSDQVRQLLLAQLQGMNKPVGADDPAIAGELQSQERGAERARQERRAAMAERLAAQGLNSGGQGSGAFDSEVASGYEDKANRLSDVRSQLFSREIQARRQQLAQLMNMALQSGDAEAARAIQMQMAQMDNAFRYANLGESSRQFNDSFGRQLGRDREEDLRWRSEFGF